MSETKNRGFASMDDEADETGIDRRSQDQHPGTGFESINEEEEASNSIGSGSSDQGIEPGDEDEDEFRRDVFSPGAEFTNGINQAGGVTGNSGSLTGNLSGEYDTNSSSTAEENNDKR